MAMNELVRIGYLQHEAREEHRLHERESGDEQDRGVRPPLAASKDVLRAAIENNYNNCIDNSRRHKGATMVVPPGWSS
jgi:hypothetical protein